MPFPTRAALVCLPLVLAALVVSCGGSSERSPAGPTPGGTPPPSSSPDAWAIEGTVVTTVGRVPVPGASVKPQFAAAVLTDAQGRFRLAGESDPGPSIFSVTITAPGHVERQVWLTWRRGTRTITLDMVAESSPFQLSFYRQIARNSYQEKDYETLLVWTTAPSFYVRTVDDRGETVDPAVIRTITETIRTAVRDFTGGRFTSVNVDTGSASRGERRGWVNVNLAQELDDNACGIAYVGANPGEITLLSGGCGCSSRRISSAIVAHEVGHALGFFHVGERRSLMYPFVSGRCASGGPSELDRHHGSIAYTRPRGNSDPDRDPQSVRLFDRRIRVVD